MTEPSKTPRTDALMVNVQTMFGGYDWNDNESASIAQQRAICMVEQHARELETALTAAQAANDRLREDAERYRWLVDSGKYCPSPIGGGWAMITGYRDKSQKSKLDAAIDAARSAK